MNSKKSRTIEEKILDCLDNKVKNIHPNLREELIQKLKTVPEAKNVSKCKSYVSKILNLPEMGNHTIYYWTARGWSIGEAYVKSKEYVKNNRNSNYLSPYSREFWMTKINPQTKTYYTETEADFERNSRRPIYKEYWMKLGYLEQDAIIKANETKNKNIWKGVEKKKESIEISKYTSKRCKEYWIIKGYSEEDAKKLVSKEQATFSLEKCIKKYGEENGRKIWLERQQKWHKSYKKSNFSKISQELFWSISSNLDSLEHIYFAQLSVDKTPDYSGTNNEFKLKLNRVYLPDFIDLKNKKIIEFDGVYWHGVTGRGNKTRDKERVETYISNGYDVINICENEYKNDKNATIEKCLNFLKK